METYTFNSKFAIGEIAYRQDKGEYVETEIIGIKATLSEDDGLFVQYLYHPFNPSQNNHKEIIDGRHLFKRDEI